MVFWFFKNFISQNIEFGHFNKKVYVNPIEGYVFQKNYEIKILKLAIYGQKFSGQIIRFKRDYGKQYA